MASTSEAVDLLPCPFCGEVPMSKAYNRGAIEWRRVACDEGDCPAQPEVLAPTESEARRLWNTRKAER
jgi:hypothetical protein